MARSVRWAETACDDLEQIAQYIERDSGSYAASFVAEMLEAARSLADFAERGRVVPELKEPSVRELLVGNYRLVYEIRQEAIYILGVIPERGSWEDCGAEKRGPATKTMRDRPPPNG